MAPDKSNLPTTLEVFAVSTRWTWVESKLFDGEVIIVAANNAVIPEAHLPDYTSRELQHPVVYRAAELPLLRLMTPEVRKLVHEIKKLFGGDVQERDTGQLDVQ